MVREFALVVIDTRDKIIDRFNLDLVTEPRGLGFSLQLNTIITDIEEIPVSLRQSLGNATLSVNTTGEQANSKAKALRLWIMKNTNRRMALEWTTRVDRLYADCKVVAFQFSEMTQSNIISIPLTIKMLSPFFDVVENIVNISPSTTGKVYPFEYPYTYGIGIVENNEIQNDYIKPIPLIVTLYGEMSTPMVTITDKSNNETYARVSFGNLTLTENMWITINAVTRKITFFDGFVERDGYVYLDPSYESFIFARENTTSFISTSVQSDKSGRMTASFRRYRL